MNDMTDAEISTEQIYHRDSNWAKKADEERKLMERAHMAIWSPVTWLHQEQIEDDYLLFNTLKRVCDDHKTNFYEVTELFLNEDRKQIETVLVQNRRISMLNDLDYLYDGKIRKPHVQKQEDLKHLMPPQTAE